MGRRSYVRIVLEPMTMEEVREIAQRFDLPGARSKDELCSRIVGHFRGDLRRLLAKGPFTRDWWNDLVENSFGGQRRRSFEEIGDEIVLCVLLGEYRDATVGDVRENHDALRSIAGEMGIPQRSLAAILDRYHGNLGIAGIVTEILDKVGDSEPSPEEATSDPASRAPSRSSDTSTPRSAPRQAPRLPKGALLCGRWEVVTHLGSGGFGSAFEVRDRRDESADMMVAKIPHDEEALALLRREFGKVRGVSHQNICSYRHSDEDRQYGYFVLMDHGGRSLETRHAGEAAPIGEAVRIVREAARGIDYLHEQDVVHGDVNPGNILIDARGRVRVTDFGVSASLATVMATRGLTRMGTELVGLHETFSAPEVLRRKPPRRGSDQYSLCLVFCAILVGVRNYEQPEAVFSVLSPAQRSAVRRALTEVVSDRFDSCSSFAQALRS